MTLTLLIGLFHHQVTAQDKVSLQIKTFDQELRPLPNIQIAINDLDFFTIGGKGTAIVEVDQSQIPVKVIRVKDERFEAASWNLSKGTIEIIIRAVTYKVMHASARFLDGTPLTNAEIRFHGLTTVTVTSDQSGRFDLPIAMNETIHSKTEFEIPNVIVSEMAISGNSVTLLLERPAPKQSIPQHNINTTKPATLNFDVTSLDSIHSLSEFYAMFRNISMTSLDDDLRLLIDAKFRELVAIRQDSIRAVQPVFIKNISDTSFVLEDIHNLLKQATEEHNTLRKNREEFENKIVLISSKLQRGVVNLTDPERQSLLRDIDALETLLTENESQFYENHNDYREIINTLREKYLEVEQLQHRLTEAERLRMEESRELRQRLFGIGGIVIVFGCLIILLITFSTRLRRQTRSLRVANERIEQINENLESIVAKRTHLLEEANKELDTFLYRASHDLRSPVLSLMGLCQIIDHIGRDEMVQHVQLATNNMSRVINKLVDISEISQESRHVKTVNVLGAINKIRNKHLVMMATGDGSRNRGALIVRKKPIQFDVECPEDLEVKTSQSLLEVILTNLIENAIFFSTLKKTDEPVQVNVSAKIHNNHLVISVRDNGVGISKLIRPKMFNMFFTGNEESKGSGLGLYTVKKCVTALHGTVDLQSEEGTYTAFTVSIPVSE